jgi:hypothetical protein
MATRHADVHLQGLQTLTRQGESAGEIGEVIAGVVAV